MAIPQNTTLLVTFHLTYELNFFSMSSSGEEIEKRSPKSPKSKDKKKSKKKDKKKQEVVAEEPVDSNNSAEEEPEEDPALAKKNGYRFQVAKELLDTEESYIKDLEMVTKVFIQPLYESKLLKAEQIEELFAGIIFADWAGIHLLAPYHDGLVAGLRERVGNWNKDRYHAKENQIGDVMLEKVCVLP